jgi:DNA-binding winged helix-turn-helix (wHTH) protein/TolB-like protein
MRANRSYDFGPFHLDPAERRLLRDDQLVALTPKCFDLLVVFVENSGHLVRKEELLEQLWPDQFVEDGNLSFNISTLRKALGEGQNGQHFIETVPKKGFRFVAPVHEREADRTELTTEAGKETTQQPEHSLPFRSISRFPLSLKIVGGLMTVSVLVYLGYSLWTRWLAAPKAPSARTIAVLPFKPLSPASRDESFEMGMTETLITKLGSINQLRVRPMSAVRTYTDLQQDPIRAGQEVEAEAVLDGTIQKAGDQVRVTARLTNVKTGEVIWAEQFDEGLTNILKMQDSISERVIQALTLKLSSEERAQLHKHYTEIPEAYDLYLQASYLFNKPSTEIFANRRKALELYELAIARDPKFAFPYVGISEF